MTALPAVTSSTSTGHSGVDEPKKRTRRTTARAVSTAAPATVSTTSWGNARLTPPSPWSTWKVRMIQCWMGKVNTATDIAQNVHITETGAKSAAP